MHVFIEGVCMPESDASSPPRIDLEDPTGDLRHPKICTSQQFFQRLLEESARPLPLESVPFRRCHYEYKLMAHESVPSVFLLRVEETHFQVTCQNPPRKREAGTVPFGLKKPRKKRAKTTKARGRAKAKAKSADVDGSVTEGLTAAEAPASQPASARSWSSSSATESSEGGCDKSSSSDSDEAERPFVTENAKKEERDTKEVIDSMIRGSNAEGSTAAGGTVAASKSTAGKTFCHSAVGVVAVGVQTANRLATCRHCLQSISRMGSRVGYAYSRVKFNSWIHTKCFAEYADTERIDLQQAIDFLVNWQEGGSQGKAASPVLATDVKNLLSTLISLQCQKEEAKPSGSSASSWQTPAK